jgi:uncharacterized protein (TIGR02145 family)
MKKVSLLLMIMVLLSCEENQPPTCVITQPSNDAIIMKGETIHVAVDASDPDGTVDEVKLFFNGIEIASIESYPYSYEISTDENDTGIYTIKATARDNEGLEGSAEIQITINAELPSVTTLNISEITSSSAVSGGDVISDGGASVTARGVCWSTSPNPTISDGFTIDGAGMGSYSSSIVGLSCGATYYVRAYATNSAGTTYGSQESFNTSQCAGSIPTVNTTSAMIITQASAQSGGTVTDDGGAEVIGRGVCWSTLQMPTIEDSSNNGGVGTGNYICDVMGLSPNTTYYVRAYAANALGIAYGNEVSFSTLVAGPDLTDYDGNTYESVAIGNQIWMAENLRVTHYADGAPIQLVEDQSAWDSLSTEGMAYCWYTNDPSMGDIYGALYTWGAAMNGAASSDADPSGVQGVCPDGWHIPSDAEWTELEMYLGMSQDEADISGDFRGTDEAEKMKETGTAHWLTNTEATNLSGLTALPGGSRHYADKDFVNIGFDAYFWTSSEFDSIDAMHRFLIAVYPQVNRARDYKGSGFSVRCVQN